MKKINTFIFFLLLFPLLLFSQNLQVSSNIYSPQELIETVLINSSCIENLELTNVVGGNFNSSDKSYGYFEANGADFPFERGVVLSTGKLTNVGGPNSSLSDDDANGWSGDLDLETNLNETNTLNATVLEFNFSAASNQISFNYIFASEEYQENNPNTCQYSDLFGFLIRKESEQAYTNIALVPNTETPVKVTTVHPEIPGSCAAINEAYFGSWNSSTAPINFNGQTAVLTATATITPNELYHVKLVIADEQNYRYDSAVFLEANSFELGTDLGVDRLLATNNALCENETLILNATQPNAATYQWFKNDSLIPAAPTNTLEIDSAGDYRVEVLLNSGCTSYGSIKIEYGLLPEANDVSLTQCPDSNLNLNTSVFDLNVIYDAATNATANRSLKFYSARIDAELDAPNDFNGDSFSNSENPQIVYIQVMDTQTGCIKVSELSLNVGSGSGNDSLLEACDLDGTEDGLMSFTLSDADAAILSGLAPSLSIRYYKTYSDAISQINPLPNVYTTTVPYSQFVYARIEDGINCYGINSLELIVLELPEVQENEQLIYCLDAFPNGITLSGGLLNAAFNSVYYSWTSGQTTAEIQVNEPGTYAVTITTTKGCSKTRSIEVLPSSIPIIDSVDPTDGVEMTSVVVNVSGSGRYEYAIDNPLNGYQDSNVFLMVSAGIHRLYVRDKNGCGSTEKNISVIGFPKFFTPNGDGFNDRWHVTGINSATKLKSDVYIFDRFGKLLTQLNPIGPGWDGSYNGTLLAESDYWFYVKLPDNQIFRGHFTLKR